MTLPDTPAAAPVPRARRGIPAGCIVVAGGYTALLILLGGILCITGLVFFRPICIRMIGLRSSLELESSMAMLDDLHSPAERAAFSNAVASLFSSLEDVVTNMPAARTNFWFDAAFRQLLAAQKDQVIMRHESAAFCTSVWRHAATTQEQ